MGTAANRQGIAAARFRRLQHFGGWQEPSVEFPPLQFRAEHAYDLAAYSRSSYAYGKEVARDHRRRGNASLAERRARDRHALALVRALGAEIPAVLAVAVAVRKLVRWGPKAYFGDPSPGRVTVRTSQFFGSDARAITWDRLRVDEWE